jgi:hypothetical protein
MAEPTLPWPDVAATPALSSESLEERVQRLEGTVTALQDTHALEDRLVERVTARLQPTGPERITTLDPQVTASAVMNAASGMIRAAAIPVGQQVARMPWLLIDLYQELFAISRMFFDLHYHVAWTTRLLVLVLVPAILTSHWWLPFSSLWVVGEFFDKLIDLVLAFVVFKALNREAQRYLEFRATQGKT